MCSFAHRIFLVFLVTVLYVLKTMYMYIKIILFTFLFVGLCKVALLVTACRLTVQNVTQGILEHNSVLLYQNNEHLYFGTVLNESCVIWIEKKLSRDVRIV